VIDHNPASRRAAWIWLLFLPGLVFRDGVMAQSPAKLSAPGGDVVHEYHGTRVADPYRWLEELDSPRADEWLKAQKKITADYVGRLPGGKENHKRLTSLSNYAVTDVPWREGGRIFYERNDGLQPQSVLYVQDGPGGSPRAVLDPNRISPDGSTAVRDYSVSPGGRLLAYVKSRGGSDVGETRVRDIATGRELRESPGVDRGVLDADARGFFFHPCAGSRARRGRRRAHREAALVPRPRATAIAGSSHPRMEGQRPVGLLHAERGRTARNRRRRAGVGK
jgi:protease II